jgi:hypothetical protein
MTLDEWLIMAGISERAFGQRIKRTQAAVNRYRRGKRRPDKLTTAAIVRETDGLVDANDLNGIARPEATRGAEAA